MKVKKIILLIGLPGSGKGTQGKVLSKKLMLPHISIGDMIRNSIKSNDNDSKILASYVTSGKLVPSELVNQFLKTALFSENYRNGCVLDGYPRNLDQADYLNKISGTVPTEVSCIFLSISDQIAIKRISGRYSCQSCGNLYNKHYEDHKIREVCDNCKSSNLVFRQDDKEEVALSRIEEYKKETLPLIQYYKEKERFFFVNASNSKEEVIKEIDLIVKRI